VSIFENSCERESANVQNQGAERDSILFQVVLLSLRRDRRVANLWTSVAVSFGGLLGLTGPLRLMIRKSPSYFGGSRQYSETRAFMTSDGPVAGWDESGEIQFLLAVAALGRFFCPLLNIWQVERIDPAWRRT
jgi:hypothetical protein